MPAEPVNFTTQNLYIVLAVILVPVIGTLGAAIVGLRGSLQKATADQQKDFVTALQAELKECKTELKNSESASSNWERERTALMLEFNQDISVLLKEQEVEREDQRKIRHKFKDDLAACWGGRQNDRLDFEKRETTLTSTIRELRARIDELTRDRNENPNA